MLLGCVWSSLFCLLCLVVFFFFNTKVLPEMEGEVWGSMKISYNMIPARTVNCEWYYLLVLADLFCSLAENNSFPDLALEISLHVGLIIYLGK